MVEPIVIPRSEHALSRRDVDPDALKVLYRLKDAGFIAYLVGGSVRDLTSAPPRIRTKSSDCSGTAG
jgi:hypothetical protein